MLEAIADRRIREKLASTIDGLVPIRNYAASRSATTSTGIAAYAPWDSATGSFIGSSGRWLSW